MSLDPHRRKEVLPAQIALGGRQLCRQRRRKGDVARAAREIRCMKPVATRDLVGEVTDESVRVG
jgi:hypothetical protein